MPPAPVRVLTDPDVRCVGLRGDRDERDHRDHGEQRVASSLHDFASDVAAKRRDGRELDKRLPKPLIYATVFLLFLLFSSRPALARAGHSAGANGDGDARPRTRRLAFAHGSLDFPGAIAEHVRAYVAVLSRGSRELIEDDRGRAVCDGVYGSTRLADRDVGRVQTIRDSPSAKVADRSAKTTAPITSALDQLVGIAQLRCPVLRQEEKRVHGGGQFRESRVYRNSNVKVG